MTSAGGSPTIATMPPSSASNMAISGDAIGRRAGAVEDEDPERRQAVDGRAAAPLRGEEVALLLDPERGDDDAADARRRGPG